MEYAFDVTIQLEGDYTGFVYNGKEVIFISWTFENGLGTIADLNGFALYTFEINDEEMHLIEIPHDKTEPGVYVLMKSAEMIIE